jgi:hypothetical protein
MATLTQKEKAIRKRWKNRWEIPTSTNMDHLDWNIKEWKPKPFWPVFPRYVRRLMFTGGTTGYITLPKSWIKKQGLKKGDLLELSIQEEKIIMKKN